jgi:UDP-glucose 4-epimerase
VKRVLITGLSSHWGGRLAQELEADPEIEAIVGIDTEDPRYELERTEFVRVDTQSSLIRRILAAAAIDTVVDTRLITDPLAPVRRAHEVNVVGTAGILDACDGPDSTVRKLVFKSSAHYYGSEAGDPAFFTEDMSRRHAARAPIERDVVDVEQALGGFAARNPAVTVTTLRFAAEIGGGRLPLLGLPVVPAMLGFDPRCQFIHENDVIGALAHAVRRRIPGPYNAAADGVLVLSEVASLLGKPLLPIMPPWGTAFAAAQLQRLGVPVPLEALRELRFGRGLDNRRLKATGYAYRYTTRESVLKLRAQQRLRPLLRSGADNYRYEREVEEFLRRSPSVLPSREQRLTKTGTNGPSIKGYDELSAEEVIGLVTSLEPEAAERLRVYEAANQARQVILEALDRRLARTRKRG